MRKLFHNFCNSLADSYICKENRIFSFKNNFIHTKTQLDLWFILKKFKKCVV